MTHLIKQLRHMILTITNHLVITFIQKHKVIETYVKQLLPFAYFDDTNKDISQFPDSRTSVVTETSKVHNDFEFVLQKTHYR